MDITKLINIEVEGVSMADYPDFVDAHISYAEHNTGYPLSEGELDELTNNHPDFVQEMAHKQNPF